MENPLLNWPSSAALLLLLLLPVGRHAGRHMWNAKGGGVWGEEVAALNNNSVGNTRVHKLHPDLQELKKKKSCSQKCSSRSSSSRQKEGGGRRVNTQLQHHPQPDTHTHTGRACVCVWSTVAGKAVSPTIERVLT